MVRHFCQNKNIVICNTFKCRSPGVFECQTTSEPPFAMENDDKGHFKVINLIESHNDSKKENLIKK